MRTYYLAILMFFCGSGEVLADNSFCFNSPGKLFPVPQGGSGREDRNVYIPDLAFPLHVGVTNKLHAYLNSQIFGVGGQYGPKGALSDPKNYRYCWADTFCEAKRGWKMPLCPTGVGHQGDDIRSDKPVRDKYEAVAFADGVVTLKTANTTVTVVSEDGTECRYLHLTPASIANLKVGQRVKKGETIIGRVGDTMNGKQRGTSLHLHFDCSQTLQFDNGIARVFVPIYTSLVSAYAKAWNLDIPVTADTLQPGSKYEQTKPISASQ